MKLPTLIIFLLLFSINSIAQQLHFETSNSIVVGSFFEIEISSFSKKEDSINVSLKRDKLSKGKLIRKLILKKKISRKIFEDIIDKFLEIKPKDIYNNNLIYLDPSATEISLNYFNQTEIIYRFEEFPNEQILNLIKMILETVGGNISWLN